jgi:NADH-quinone oxidoreductase subunit N
MIQGIDYHAILPEIVLGGAALLVLIIDLFLGPAHKWLAMPLSLFGVLGSLVATLTFAGNVGGANARGTFCVPGTGTCSFVVDNYAVIFKCVFLVSALVVLLLSLNYFEEGRYYQGEYYFLLLCSFFGMLAIASSRDLIMLFISLEIVSVPGFVIAGFRKSDTRSNEAAIKFFLFGVLSTAVMLFGMSLVYGLTGSLQLTTIAERLGTDPRTPAALAAVGLVITGFAFKVSAAPFHFWAPDTYQGAPVPVAAFLSVASKAAGFTGLMTICFIGFRPYADVWGPLLAILAVITMTLGNLVAIQQRHMVRLLAYSSVAQAGYMLVPFGVAASIHGRANLDDAFAATLSYIAIYAVMNLGVFACVIAVARRTPRNLIADYRGLVKTSPVLATTLAFFLFCLAGAPPGVAGLFAKFVVFRAAVDGQVVWLAVVMAVNTVIAAYYYLKLAFNLFAGLGDQPGEEPLAPARIPAAIVAAIGVTAVGALVLSFYPQVMLDVTPRAVFALVR